MSDRDRDQNVVREVLPPRVQYDQPHPMPRQVPRKEFTYETVIHSDVKMPKDDRMAKQLAKWLRSHGSGCECKLCADTKEIVR
jgi:hypothetical protein